MSDAWIFLSIGSAGGAKDWVGLDQIIGMADGYNHAIPTLVELEASISNLVGAGVAEYDQQKARLTDLGKDVFNRSDRPSMGHITRLFELGKEWKAAGYPPTVTPFISINREHYEAALATYSKRFKEAYQRLVEKQRMSGKENGDLRSYLRANLRVYRPEEGNSRAWKVHTGYRPNWDLKSDHSEEPLRIFPGGAEVELESGSEIWPGGVGQVRMRPMYPENWTEVSAGQVLYAREGKQIIAEATIIEIIPAG